ncbi:secondary thiamine-phosphate synthase enzyme YjbQ [Pontibaca salina]|uniref:YjbQ family protein n=1 Tax=Pontibaca salina TaxID=2795731 RepID=A0A934HQI8_9RHOB|nr:secondary thiamine-phosphate synthase enzyme YjbQ [Pontibaca salina]MBI6629867.1 YjbQ family protein [Pontibaca salina]
MQTEFAFKTNRPGLYEITDDIAAWLMASAVESGLLTLFLRHSSASLLIQENADPDVQRDLAEFMRRLVPHGDDQAMSWLRHTVEGPDDMPAHIKAALLPVSLSIPVSHGQMLLGNWQGIYLFEHRDAPHTRRVAAHLCR